jgi:hypothetical protein
MWDLRFHPIIELTSVILSVGYTPDKQYQQGNIW